MMKNIVNDNTPLSEIKDFLKDIQLTRLVASVLDGTGTLGSLEGGVKNLVTNALTKKNISYVFSQDKPLELTSERNGVWFMDLLKRANQSLLEELRTLLYNHPGDLEGALDGSITDFDGIKNDKEISQLAELYQIVIAALGFHNEKETINLSVQELESGDFNIERYESIVDKTHVFFSQD